MKAGNTRLLLANVEYRVQAYPDTHTDRRLHRTNRRAELPQPKPPPTA